MTVDRTTADELRVLLRREGPLTPVPALDAPRRVAMGFRNVFRYETDHTCSA